MLHILTGQLGRYRGPDGLDTTMKSARGVGRVFAPPSWGMVMAFKRGLVDLTRKLGLGDVGETIEFCIRETYERASEEAGWLPED